MVTEYINFNRLYLMSQVCVLNSKVLFTFNNLRLFLYLFYILLGLSHGVSLCAPLPAFDVASHPQTVQAALTLENPLTIKGVIFTKPEAQALLTDLGVYQDLQKASNGKDVIRAYAHGVRTLHFYSEMVTVPYTYPICFKVATTAYGSQIAGLVGQTMPFFEPNGVSFYTNPETVINDVMLRTARVQTATSYLSSGGLGGLGSNTMKYIELMDKLVKAAKLG